MKLFRYLLPMVVALGFASSAAYAHLDQDGSRFLEELNERDFDSLRDFINTKRTIDVAEKACNLTISGDVRTEWRHLNERQGGNELRGHRLTDPISGLPISKNDFDIEFNLRFDYVCDRAWAVAHIQFDNSAGVDDNGQPCRVEDGELICADPEGYHGSGFCEDVCLKKAYMGYNICCDGASRFDVELGRRNLYNAFDSKVQFLSRFDGILLTYSTCLECISDFYVKAAAFVVDERVNHFAYVAEVGFVNIYDSCIDFKYSFIDWRKNGINRCCATNPKGFKFLVSQWTLCYHFNPEMLCMPARVYGAFLLNHQGKLVLDHHRARNIGWYVGFTIGEVVQEGDWSIDVQYQVVGAGVIPDNDVSGIGRGNTYKESVTSCTGRGNTNFRGWRIEGLYAITDNLSLDSILEWSRQDDTSIGGRHHYSKFELEAIYAF